MFFTVEISRVGEMYKIRCSELEVETTANTVEEGITKLKKIIDFTMSVAKENLQTENVSYPDNVFNCYH